jgi:hypothetical protein
MSPQELYQSLETMKVSFYAGLSVTDVDRFSARRISNYMQANNPQPTRGTQGWTIWSLTCKTTVNTKVVGDILYLSVGNNGDAPIDRFLVDIHDFEQREEYRTWVTSLNQDGIPIEMLLEILLGHNSTYLYDPQHRPQRVETVHCHRGIRNIIESHVFQITEVKDGWTTWTCAFCNDTLKARMTGRALYLVDRSGDLEWRDRIAGRKCETIPALANVLYACTNNQHLNPSQRAALQSQRQDLPTDESIQEAIDKALG